jgi:hypothetical protein
MSNILDAADLNEALIKYMNMVQRVSNDWHNEHYPTNTKDVIEVEIGKRYVKVWKSLPGSRSIHTFIDRQTGNILKAGTWKAPQKNGVRGNIFAADCGESCIDWHGAKYIK